MTAVFAGPGGERVLDGFGQVLHNRWNRDLPPAAVVRPGQVIQLLCRDALDIGERGQSSGFATFTGAETDRQARIPVAPFMGIYGVAPLRKGMYRTLPPNVSGGMGGNADIRQFVKRARIQFPV